MDIMKKYKTKVATYSAIIILSLCLSFLFYVPILTSGNTIGIQDWDQNFAWSEFTRISILKYNQFPFWNPYKCGGAVHFANPEIPVISIQTLFVLLFGTLTGIKGSIFFHGVLGFVGFYLLARYYKLSKYGSILASIIFSYSGITGSFLSTGMVVFMVFTYSPYILLFFHKGTIHRKWIVIASVLYAFSYYAGYHIPLLLITYISIYSLVDSILKKSIKPLISLLLFSIIATIVAFPKLILSLQLISYFPRLKIDESGYKFMHFLYFLFSRRQNLFGDIGISGYGYSIDENSLYVGAIPIILFLIFFVKNIKVIKRKAVLICSLVVIIFLMFGEKIYPSLYGFIHQFPPFSSFRVAQRFRFDFIIPFALLTGLGLDNLMRFYEKKRKNTIYLFIFIFIFIFIPLFVFVDLTIFSKSNFLSKTLILKNNLATKKNVIFTQNKSWRINKKLYYVGDLPTQYYGVSNKKSTFVPWSYEYIQMQENIGTINCSDVITDKKYAIGRDEKKYRGEYYLEPRSDIGTITQIIWSPNLLKYKLHYVEINTKLIVNQNYFPGWWVMRGDCWEEAISSNGLLSTKIKKGEKEITFVYYPYLFINQRCR